MEPDRSAGNKALDDVLTDEGLWLWTMLLALDHVIVAHCAAQQILSGTFYDWMNVPVLFLENAACQSYCKLLILRDFN
ncbi:hypothetical protein DFO68_11381 [Halomonas ventosae]|uniref:Uncharacterized protein n=2 Tax=Halomonadaceae TaxID=28256 RepID=A0A4R6HDY2_9GAMM|nr:hypothetical protein DFO68_11381 [Halomonas ventosae]